MTSTCIPDISIRKLQERLTAELVLAISYGVDQPISTGMKQVQPPITVIHAAAEAAASVLVAYEIGRIMDVEQTDQGDAG